MNNNILMVIPGAKSQVPLITALKDNGYEIVCIDPHDDSPAFLYADYAVKGDILDRDLCLQIARQYKVLAVMSDECDIAMPTVAYVSEKLGLPTFGTALARLYTDKYEMRKFSQKQGFPCPRYKKCYTKEEAEVFYESIEDRKMIIKPLDSNSSRGVYTIHSKEELSDLFWNSLQYSKIEKAILCEEYIEGVEFTVDGIVINGKHRSLAISKKKHYSYNQNIACELFFSSYDDDYDYEKLRQQNNEYVEKSGMPFGFTHAEYKFNGKDFVLIEIGARGGGNFISSHIVQALYEIDPYKILLNTTLGKEESELSEKPPNIDRCAVLSFFDVKGSGGRVIGIENETCLSEDKDVLLYEFRFKEGDYIKQAENDSARVGFYIARKETRKELLNFMKKIEENVHIVFEDSI